MGIILWIVLGAIAGWLASMIMKSGYGILGDIVIGIVGAVIGGFIMNLLGYGGVNGFNVYSILVAVLGAVVLLWIVKAARGNGARV
ncbi:MAG: Transglycosylase-associated protein [Candidatus Doudnabacteria bacterium]|nr:Transglycosylase-associated protein [Candidatus Doudnabacteria bacterium]